MCGVVGIYAYASGARPVDRAELRAVRDHMATRGPDGQGEWISDDARVGLGHRRLSIIDLSERGAQPMANADGRLVISFNGEIYNYRELKAQLERSGRVFRSNSDTEVLLHLYELHGAAMLPMLRGMFAFALWDSSRREMLLARDPFGIKPLYYADDGRTLRAASQVKALLRAEVDTRPDPAGHAGFFLWGSVPAPYTLYRGIRAVPAGHWVKVTPDRPPLVQAYASIAAILGDAAQNPAHGSRSEALDAVRAAMQESMKAHLISDVPVGVFLSSGLDSGMICANVSRETSQPHAITLGFKEYGSTADDEAPLAQEIARRLGCRHDLVQVDRSDFEEELPRFLESMDQPSIDGLNTWFVARAAASRGIKVALSGLGGDELLASYPSFRDVPRIRRAIAPLGLAPAFARGVRRIAAPLLAPFTSPKYAGLLEYGNTLEGAYLLRRALFMPWELPRCMDPDMAREGLETLDCMGRLRATTAATGGPAHERMTVSALEMDWYMQNQLLRDADWAGMAHSVEIRTPLVDFTLLRQVAPWLAAHPDISKLEIADAVAPSMHGSWLKRPKTGFNIPVREWMGARSQGTRGLRGWADRVYGAGPSAAPGSPGRGMKVLLLTTDSYGGHGGIAFYNRCLAEALAQMPQVGEVVVLPRLMRFANPDVPAKIRFVSAACGSKLRYILNLLRLLGEEFDLVICGHSNLVPAAVPFARFKRVPLILQVHGIEVWQPTARPASALLRFVDAVWSVSQLTADRMNAWARLPADKYRVIPNTFHPAQFGVAPRDPRLVQQYGLEGRKVVMTLARLAGFDRYKGIDEILECLSSLRDAEPAIIYVVVGDGDDQARLEEKARSLGVSQHVVFTGFVPEARKADHLRLADVFALPGRGEGFGIVLLEALACGVPVVGSQVDGSREALLGGRMGELADPDSLESVRECILRAMAKPHEVPGELATFGWEAFRQHVAENVSALVHPDPAAILSGDRLLSAAAPRRSSH